MGDFRKLIVWQEAQRLAVLSRDAIATLPRTELYALGNQWRRAAYSVALNIAEGAAQSSPRQFCRYLEIAKGSLDELQGVLELAEALGYISDPQLSELRLVRTHCARLVWRSRGGCPVNDAPATPLSATGNALFPATGQR